MVTKIQAYALKYTILALVAMFAVQLLSPMVSKYFNWAGTTFSVYLYSFVILFVTLMITDLITRKVWAI